MPSLARSDVRNRLLRHMSEGDFPLLAPDLQPCKAGKGTLLFDKGAAVETVWFMDSGIGSLMTISPEGHRIESGLFDRDGFAPTVAAMGGDITPVEGVVQVADDCWRLGIAPFREAIAASPSLHTLLLRYVQALSVQTAHTALSNAIHPIDERLARWLLMCHDRVDNDELSLTHDFLAIMLAVRRPSVTTALHVLEGNGFIRAERGCVVIRNRAALEEFAADSYGPPEREYERLIGPLR